MSESVGEIYEKLAQEASTKSVGGAKAETIRAFVRDSAAELGKDKVVLSAMFHLMKKNTTSEVKRAYFNQVVTKAWETEKDDKGTVWIDLTRPKAKAA